MATARSANAMDSGFGNDGANAVLQEGTVAHRPPTLDGVLREMLRDVVREVVREELRGALASLALPAAPEPKLIPQYLTPQEAARFCGVSEKTIRAWVQEGKLAERRAGRLLRIERCELEAYLAKRTAAPSANRLDVDALARHILAYRKTK